MRVVIDTNVLTRLSHIDNPLHTSARQAVLVLRGREDELCVLPQCLYEFWLVSTRPKDQNGFGMTSQRAHAEIAEIKAIFTLLPEPSGVYEEWEQLVLRHDVKGKRAHDARLVAAMRIRQLDALLTFNISD